MATEQQPHDGWALQRRVGDIMYDRGDWDFRGDPQRHGRLHPAEGALAVLRLFGAIEGTRLTPLGVWARAELQRVVPPQITPELPAKNVLDLLAGSDEVDAWHRATRRFGERTVAQIVAELVPCAAEAAPAQWVTAISLISGLGDDAVAALRAAERLPNLAAHARAMAHQHGQAPMPDTEDLVWLAVEYAHADLTRHGVAAARYTATDYPRRPPAPPAGVHWLARRQPDRVLRPGRCGALRRRSRQQTVDRTGHGGLLTGPAITRRDTADVADVPDAPRLWRLLVTLTGSRIKRARKAALEQLWLAGVRTTAHMPCRG